MGKNPTDLLVHGHRLLDEEAKGCGGAAARADSHSQWVAEWGQMDTLLVPGLVFFPFHPTVSRTGVP